MFHVRCSSCTSFNLTMFLTLTTYHRCYTLEIHMNWHEYHRLSGTLNYIHSVICLSFIQNLFFLNYWTIFNALCHLSIEFHRVGQIVQSLTPLFQLKFQEIISLTLTMSLDILKVIHFKHIFSFLPFYRFEFFSPQFCTQLIQWKSVIVT